MTEWRCLAPQNLGQRALLRGCGSPQSASWASPASVPSASPAQLSETCRVKLNTIKQQSQPDLPQRMQGLLMQTCPERLATRPMQVLHSTKKSTHKDRGRVRPTSGSPARPCARLCQRRTPAPARACRPSSRTSHCRSTQTTNDACRAWTMHFPPMQMPCMRHAQRPCCGLEGHCRHVLTAFVLSRFVQGIDDSERTAATYSTEYALL